jgi:hypothetical protein
LQNGVKFAANQCCGDRERSGRNLRLALRRDLGQEAVGYLLGQKPQRLGALRANRFTNE